MRRWDWATPPPRVHREVLSALPAAQTRRPPLLFVPDAGRAASSFTPTWLPGAAERGFPAYAVSLRGHGGSGGAGLRGRTVLRDYVHDVLQAVVALPVRPVLVGHGLGALVVARVLARYPARAAVLLTPAVPGRGSEPPLVRCQLAVSRVPDPSFDEPPVLVVGDRTAAAASVAAPAPVRRAAQRPGRTLVWVDGAGTDLLRQRRPLELILDWVERVAQPVVAADAGETVAGRAGGQGTAGC
jgi:pimeloyl-ACP methyl ester carboxylesterase